MRIILDTDGETLVRETQFDIAVPVHMETLDGETKIFAYPSVKSLCEDYAARFADDLYADVALDFLAAGCNSLCRELGYTPDRHSIVSGYNFLQRREPRKDLSICKRIRRDGRYKNLTTFDLSACLAAERAIFAVVEADSIVSVAVSCEALAPENENRCVEISVETAPSFRNRGYAAACAATLASHLSSFGRRALYKCRRENAASASAARAAGFEKCGDFAYFVYRRNG